MERKGGDHISSGVNVTRRVGCDQLAVEMSPSIVLFTASAGTPAGCAWSSATLMTGFWCAGARPTVLPIAKGGAASLSPSVSPIA